MPTTLNKKLLQAKINKKDEFYTSMTDIEKELCYYMSYFKNKTILLNCDDPENSNFWRYFNNNFGIFKLKKLIATHYHKNHATYYLEINSYGQKSLKIPLQGNGDFRSEECINILKQADIIITNPPFSLFQEYVNQLMEYRKKFIILGSQNKLGITSVFRQVMKNKIWLGINHGVMSFKSPYENTQTGKNKEDLIAIPNMCWFTNLDHNKRHDEIILTAKYNELDYPMYVNYDAINCDKVADIPKDYNGIIGVPISYMHKHNPQQFKIIGVGTSELCTFKNNFLMTQLSGSGKGKIVKNGKGCVYIKYNPLYRNNFYGKSIKYKDCKNNSLYVVPYKRILIQKILN